MAQIEVGALDPVSAFVSTLKDLIEITEVFKSSESIPPIDYLRATAHAKDVFAAVQFVILSSQMSLVADRLTPEVRAEFDAEITARDLAADTSMAGHMAHIKRVLEPFSTAIDIDTDNLPPGLGFPEDGDV